MRVLVTGAGSGSGAATARVQCATNHALEALSAPPDDFCRSWPLSGRS